MAFLGVFGHVNMDYIMNVTGMPKPSSSAEVLDGKRYFGGVAGNIARISARLGVPVALASFVGADFPKEYYDALKKLKIDLTDFIKCEDYITPTCWIMTDVSQNQFSIINQGPMRDMLKLGFAEHTVKNSEIVHISTGRPEYYMKIVELASKLKKKIAFDPAQEIYYLYTPEYMQFMLSHANFYFVNEAEYKLTLKMLGLKTKEDLLKLVEYLVITKGENGSEISTKDYTIHVPAIKPKKIVDPTGAGDAYRSGFYAGLSRKLPIEECGLLGASMASFTLEAIGGQGALPTFEEVNERVKSSGLHCKIEKHAKPII
ncbi:MAG: carbohydrate kinase family protein [Thermoplasmata archaeon]